YLLPGSSRPHLRSFPTRRSSDLSALSSTALARSACSVPAGICSRVWRIACVSSSIWSWVTQPAEMTASRVSPKNAIAFDVEDDRSEEHTSELQSRENLVCRLLLE